MRTHAPPSRLSFTPSVRMASSLLPNLSARPRITRPLSPHGHSRRLQLTAPKTSPKRARASESGSSRKSSRARASVIKQSGGQEAREHVVTIGEARDVGLGFRGFYRDVPQPSAAPVQGTATLLHQLLVPAAQVDG